METRRLIVTATRPLLLLTILVHAGLLAVSNTLSSFSADFGMGDSSFWDGVVPAQLLCSEQTKDAKKSPRPRNFYEADNDASQILQPRAFPIRRDPVPCLPEHTTTRWMRDTSPTDTGFLFLKTHKTASSTAAGVHLRIARQMALDTLVNPHNINTTLMNRTNSKSNNIMCKVRINHAKAREEIVTKPETEVLPKQDRFLWTMVRDPTDRLESVLSSRNEARSPNYYAQFLSLEPWALFAQNETKYLQNILDSYDFMGVTERLDESLVALSFLLNLPLSHFLYLSAKENGGFDAGNVKGTCRYIPPSFVSKGMRAFMATPEFQKHVQWDHLLHQAAHASLDRTIHETIGYELFAQRLQEFRHAQRIAQEKCLDRTIFPCSAENERRPIPNNETDCLWKDSGCGYECLDEVATELGLRGLKD